IISPIRGRYWSRGTRRSTCTRRVDSTRDCRSMTSCAGLRSTMRRVPQTALRTFRAVYARGCPGWEHNEISRTFRRCFRRGIRLSPTLPRRRIYLRTFCGADKRMAMRHEKLTVFATAVAALLLAGCASPPGRVLSQKSPAYAMLPNGMDPLNPQRVSPMYAAATEGEPNGVRLLERKLGRALNMLSLSGGGQNGAFGAGLLNGWRESGQRPQFDMVGGGSTGALLATHALLGTPADDAQLEEMYTQISKKNIHSERGIFSLAFGADSLSDTAPLRALIAKYITADTLKRVAAAYNDNRYLFIGT